MLITSAEFIVSNQKVSNCPNTAYPEYAFIGRSNVGKSSLINMLTGRKNLAKTSGRPGKTQLINHFLINKNWFLVDLPGYGYARASKKEKKKFQTFITAYFRERQQLVAAFVLIDIRHEPQPIDLDFMAWMGDNQIPFSIVFTKSDKLKPGVIDRHLEAYQAKMLESWETMPPYFVTSSLHYRGKEALLTYIDTINEGIRRES